MYLFSAESSNESKPPVATSHTKTGTDSIKRALKHHKSVFPKKLTVSDTPDKHTIDEGIDQLTYIPTTGVTLKNSSAKIEIPLNIFQTWHTLELPPKMKENVELLKLQNPEFKYHLYDDNMCRDFIASHFDEDVLYTFNKLKPGAYKADLWRYCVLYIYGGIYLDIKYKCINGFKLIYLTDKEYWVKDISHFNGRFDGVFQALMICMPNNKRLFKAIHNIVEYCSNNDYTDKTSLAVTGPGLLANYFTKTHLYNFRLENLGDTIIDKQYNNIGILKPYKEYREEQYKNQLLEHYNFLWHKRCIYNYPVLRDKKTVDLTSTMIKEINGVNVELYSGTPTIINCNNNKYQINMPFINYTTDENGNKNGNLGILVNSRFHIDSSLNKIGDMAFTVKDYEKYNGNPVGLENIHIINHKNQHYYIASMYTENMELSGNYYGTHDSENNSGIIVNKCEISHKLNENDEQQKWTYVVYGDDIGVVYNWFPLKIGYINSEDATFEEKKTYYTMPRYFQNAESCASSFVINGENWILLQKSQSNTYNKTVYNNYQHFFAVFDLEMNLLRYSELFKLSDFPVEKCRGLIVNDTCAIISYSLNDTRSFVSSYDIKYIKYGLEWYTKVNNKYNMHSIYNLAYRIVVARYDENIEWLYSEFNNCIIYNKGEKLNIANEIILDNVGREPEVYLNYIIANYDNLPEVVVFTQANIANHFETNDIHYLLKIKNEALAKGKSIPTVSHYRQDGSKDKNCWDKDWNVDGDQYFLHDCYKEDRRTAFIDWFKENINPIYPNPIHIYRHSIFAIKRDNILKRPLEYYKHIINEVNHHNNPAERHFIERSWYYMFA